MAKTLNDITLRCAGCDHYGFTFIQTTRKVRQILEYDLDENGRLIVKKCGEPRPTESYEWEGYECPKCGEFAQTIEGLLKE